MWTTAARTAWQIDPAIAIHLTERTKSAFVHQEIRRLVRSSARESMDVPEALRFLIDDTQKRRDLKVSPVIRVSINRI
jgi:phosphatidylinositol 4-kinase